ncbi:MAG TPA: 3-ketoacyl-ACP reductase FabG2 [Bdellovibrionota bacterium]|jgi:3-oxoacyl-[acyl-carrier protein] reductase|nr:3-ketoacyl-ACP reductase FabG2 [Bdellovibrionota bacterium]
MNQEKSILVTGASKGIGRAIALDLARQGFSLALHYGSDRAGAEATLAEVTSHGGSARLLQFDLKAREAVKATLESDMKEFGAYYGIVCNAGICRDTAFPAMTDDDWDAVIDTNLGGFYNVVRPCVMPMVHRRQPGRIVVISSVSGIAGNRGQVNYSASKAGLMGAVKALAVELGKRQITVNCVAPGLIDTGMVSDEIFDHAKAMIPLQRMGKPEEVAGLVTYLMSDSAAYVTRQVISVNGGMV